MIHNRNGWKRQFNKCLYSRCNRKSVNLISFQLLRKIRFLILIAFTERVKYCHCNNDASWSKPVIISSLWCWYPPFQNCFVILGKRILFCKDILLDISMLRILVGILFGLSDCNWTRTNTTKFINEHSII